MTCEEKRQIDKLSSQGYGCTAISNMLGISINTVKSYFRRNKSKEEKIKIRNAAKGGCEFCADYLAGTQGQRQQVLYISGKIKYREYDIQPEDKGKR